jgi:hypothetical protein
VYQLSFDQIPANIHEALENPKWIQLIKEEMEALHNNKTWNLVPAMPLIRIVGCKCIFLIKHKADGPIGIYKAHINI